ncbi:MAG: DUF3459 domain-containing protein [Actinophytocola sp.]|nr:DUF3459 domain-containing protein [Actinophytocola sp.]
MGRGARSLESAATEESWWRSATFYQVYVPSFADSDGDGVGDLEGVRSRLGYLELLGVDALWLTPFYPSPMVDNGYDVANPRGVDPRFGDLDAFDALVTEAHAHGIKITIDLVPNHVSYRHPWFTEALGAAAGSQERDRFLFRDGKGEHGEEPPNNWVSAFGGQAWTQVDEPDGQWYLHLFAPEQPDLNWENTDVRQDFERTMRFWLDRGVDGFRIDVAHGMAKPAELPDMDLRAATSIGGDEYFDPRFNNDGVHRIHEFFRSVLDAYPGTMATGELWTFDDERFGRYLGPDQLHLGFNFRLVLTHFDADALHTAIDQSLAAPLRAGVPATWALGNHDIWRQVSRYGDGEVGVRRARSMALVELALPGVAYLYNGEELGLPNVDLPPEAVTDPSMPDSRGQSRDAARVPIPWQDNTPPFGFSTTADTWLPMPAEWAALTVESQLEDPSSTLSLYRAALELRREHSAFSGSEIDWYGSPAGCFAFRRAPSEDDEGAGGLVCVLNTSASPVDLPPGELLLSSADLVDGQLPPDAAAWLA